MKVSADALIESLPLMVGYHPSRALAFVVLDEQGKVCPVGVAPCPDGWEPGFASTINQCVAQHGASVILIAYHDDHEAARQMVEAASAAIVAPITGALYTDGAHWRDVANPTQPNPVSTEPTSDLALSLIMDGAAAAPNRATVTARIAPPAEHEADHLLGILSQAQARIGDHDDPRGLLRSMIEQFTADTADTDGIFPTAEEALTLAALVSDIARRDLAWLLMTRANAAEHSNLWQHVVSRTPRTHAAGALALYGFASWIAGSTTGTNDAIEALAKHHPDYTMGHLLNELIDGQVPPSIWDEPALQTAAHGLMAE